MVLEVGAQHRRSPGGGRDRRELVEDDQDRGAVRQRSQHPDEFVEQRAGVTQRVAGSPRIAAIGVTTVPDGNHAHRGVISQFVDDAVDADAVGPQAGEPSTELVADLGHQRELAERVENGIGEQQVERRQRRTRGTGEEDSSHYERLRAACRARTSSNEATSPAARADGSRMADLARCHSTCDVSPV